MTYNVHQLNRNLHSDFLAEQRQDPITKEYLREGDRVVACQVCGAAFLEHSWRYQENRHCGQALTATELRARTNTGRFSKRLGRTRRPPIFPSPIPAPTPTPTPVRPPVTPQVAPQIGKVVGGIFAVILLCTVGSTIIGYLGSLGRGTGSSATAPTSGPVSNPPRTNTSVNLPSSFDRSYSGTINDGNEFSMTLKKSGTKLEGRATTSKSWDKLSGTVESDGSFYLEAYEKGKKHTGNYSGSFTSDSSISGSWSSVGGYENIEFYLSQK